MKTRIISALVMCALLLPILFIGGIYFKILAIALGIASMHEIIKARENKSKFPLIIKLISFILIGAFVYLGTDVYSVKYDLIVIFLLHFVPVVLINDTSKYSITDALYILGSTVFLGVAFNSFVYISNQGNKYLIYLLLVTIMTDTFAYFTGYFIGKHKMCEKISPKKTWEGAIGGSIMGTIIAVLFYHTLLNSEVNLFVLIGITLLLTVVGQIGDLFFSSIKRHYKIKDFSNLIPGHGGVLDRLDSIIFVVLTFILFIGIL